MLFEMVEIIVEQVEVLVIGYIVGCLGLWVGFIVVYDEVVDFFFEIGLLVWIVDCWCIECQIWYFFGDDILMFDWLQWYVDVCYCVYLLCLLVSVVDDFFVSDVVLIGFYGGDYIIFDVEVCYMDIFEDFGVMYVCVVSQ